MLSTFCLIGHFGTAKKVQKRGTSKGAIYITQKAGNVAPPKLGGNEAGTGFRDLGIAQFSIEFIGLKSQPKNCNFVRTFRVVFRLIFCRLNGMLIYSLMSLKN